jgi:hypothetical protein
MSAEHDLLAAAQTRANAWQGLRDQLSGLKSDLVSRPLGIRVRDRVVHEMVDAVDGAGGIIRETGPAIGVTIGLLAVWSLREPLGEFADWIWTQRPRWMRPRRKRFGDFWQ